MAPLPNPRHEVFCQYYVHGHPSSNGSSDWRAKAHHNATRSYEAAGYSATGESATRAAMRLLRREDVQARISELEESGP